MTFFLIVPSVMIVGVFLVHGVFNRLGLRMHFGALILCAVLSVAADVGAAMLSTAPDRNYFINLGGFIFGAALIATSTNYFLVRRKLAAEKIDAETRAAYLEDLAERIERAEEIKTAEKIPEPVEVERPKVNLVKKPRPKKILKPVAKIKPAEPVKVEAVKKIEPVAKIEQVKKVESPKILTTTAEGKVVKKFEPEKISKPVKEVAKLSTQPKLPEPAKKPATTQIKPPEPVKKPAPTSAQIKTAETLDDILESAYSEKSQGRTWQAIAAYQKALEKYRNDDYAPFVAIDLGNVYKEQAMYAKAIKTFEEALELPAVKRNAKTTADFKKNIVYLRTVQSVLLRHQALTTPFSRISKIYLREIETEFQTMQADLN